MASRTLSADQAHALFDILCHHETYTEIEFFKQPGTILNYGPPFQPSLPKAASAPILQSLLSRFVLTLPGIRDVSVGFWTERLQPLIEDLAGAELSESYDKGIMGIRKTLATAISALLEYPARGIFGGLTKRDVKGSEKSYDLENPEDLEQAWRDFLQELVHGDMIDILFNKVAETDKLSDHTELVQAAHEYVLVNLASLLYQVLVSSPKGPPLLSMIERAHKLLPYIIIRQTLKIGNVATMINGMMKLLLAKMSLNSLSNWAGLSKSADEGMNLLQRIISIVLDWEVKELRSRANKIEKNSDSPNREQLAALKSYGDLSREKHLQYRSQSEQESVSIIYTILSYSNVSTDLSESQHSLALTYLSLHLSIRDRHQLISVLCKRNPDLLTAAIKDGVAAYEPIIRAIHQAVDLSGTVADAEAFINDLIKTSKPSGGKIPTVEDFIALLKKHQSSCHRFLHQVAHNGVDITETYRSYAKHAVEQFKGGTDGGAGAMTDSLNELLRTLSDDDRATVMQEVDAHVDYLAITHAASQYRLRAVLDEEDDSAVGPGMYIVKWAGLLDQTLITPATLQGPVRHGDSASVQEAAKITVNGEKVNNAPRAQDGNEVDGNLRPPDVSTIRKLLLDKFRTLITGKN